MSSAVNTTPLAPCYPLPGGRIPDATPFAFISTTQPTLVAESAVEDSADHLECRRHGHRQGGLEVIDREHALGHTALQQGFRLGADDALEPCFGLAEVDQ